MPRIARIVIPDYPHHITQRGTNKEEIFQEEADFIYFLKCLGDSLSKTKTTIWAYCLMPNHFHLLLVPKELVGLGSCLHRTTFLYAQYFNKKYGRIGRLWQNRFFSCPVDKEEYLWAVSRYIEKNPVQAGLVRKVEDWRWSSGRAHLLGESYALINLFPWLGESEKKDYRDFMVANGEDNLIRKSTSTGRPLGSLSVIERLEKISGRRLFPKKGGRPKKNRGLSPY
jgi:putative transposase